MSIEEIRTFLDIQDAVIARAKIKDDTDNRAIVKEKINTVMQKVCFEKPYRWLGVTAPILLKARYTTGTVAVTNGSDTITGTSTSWVANTHEGRKIKLGTVTHPFRIIRVSESDQVITLDAPYTGATASGLTYTMFKDEYGLFPDLQDIRKLRIPGLNKNRHPIPCGPNEIDIRRDKAPFAVGTPTRYTINGHNIYTEKTWAQFNLNTDFFEDALDSTPRNKNLIVHPGILISDRIALVRYTKTVEPMSENTDEPPIPYENRMVLVWGTLVDHFMTNRDAQTMSMWKSEYLDQKMKMAGDIETTDDELVLTYDRRGTFRQSGFIDYDDKYLYD